VPSLYSSSRRILEMEYLSDAKSLVQALRQLPAGERRRFQREVSERCCNRPLAHLCVPGNPRRPAPGQHHGRLDGSLYLIDWGNTVPLEGKWRRCGRTWAALSSPTPTCSPTP